jgi:hypothetical protein
MVREVIEAGMIAGLLKAIEILPRALILTNMSAAVENKYKQLTVSRPFKLITCEPEAANETTVVCTSSASEDLKVLLIFGTLTKGNSVSVESL